MRRWWSIVDRWAPWVYFGDPLEPKRRGCGCHQLRANAALLIEWLIICWREGWLPNMQRGPVDDERVFFEDGTLFADSLRDLGLNHAYGTKAVERGIGEQRPTAGSRRNSSRSARIRTSLRTT